MQPLESKMVVDIQYKKKKKKSAKTIGLQFLKCPVERIHTPYYLYLADDGPDDG